MGGRKEKERQKLERKLTEGEGEREKKQNTENLLQHLLEKQQQHSRENTAKKAQE